MSFLSDTFTDTVKVYVDSAADGSSTDDRMGVKPRLRPVPGLHAVTCKVVFVRGRNYMAFDKPNAIGMYKIQFLEAINLNTTNWIEWFCEALNRTLLLNVDGTSWPDPKPPTDAIESTWGCNAVEYAL